MISSDLAKVSFGRGRRLSAAYTGFMAVQHMLCDFWPMIFATVLANFRGYTAVNSVLSIDLPWTIVVPSIGWCSCE